MKVSNISQSEKRWITPIIIGIILAVISISPIDYNTKFWITITFVIILFFGFSFSKYKRRNHGVHLIDGSIDDLFPKEDPFPRI